MEQAERGLDQTESIDEQTVSRRPNAVTTGSKQSDDDLKAKQVSLIIHEVQMKILVARETGRHAHTSYTHQSRGMDHNISTLAKNSTGS